MMVLLILFCVLIVFAFISFLVCIISCCQMYNCFCGCLERMAMTCGCIERDYAYYDDNYNCCNFRNTASQEARNMFDGCRVVPYEIDKSSVHWCCVKKQMICHNATCTICLDDYILGEEVILCPCGHCYHKKCIKSWLRVKNICPLCKVRIGRRTFMDERTPLLHGRLPPV